MSRPGLCRPKDRIIHALPIRNNEREQEKPAGRFHGRIMGSEIFFLYAPELRALSGGKDSDVIGQPRNDRTGDPAGNNQKNNSDPLSVPVISGIILRVLLRFFDRKKWDNSLCGYHGMSGGVGIIKTGQFPGSPYMRARSVVLANITGGALPKGCTTACGLSGNSSLPALSPADCNGKEAP